MERYSVDRINEGIAVLEKEDMSYIEIRTDSIPFEISEGNILLFDGNTFYRDVDEEKARRDRILKKQRNIFKKT